LNWNNSSDVVVDCAQAEAFFRRRNLHFHEGEEKPEQTKDITKRHHDNNSKSKRQFSNIIDMQISAHARPDAEKQTFNCDEFRLPLRWNLKFALSAAKLNLKTLI
jgi:hypothetical protein